MNPTIEVAVDISNPGQVFACCGIFELAHRMTTGERRALGWFEDIDEVHTKFLIEAYDQNDNPVKLNDILIKLKECELTELEYNDKEGPVFIGKPFNLIIDWRNPYPQNGSVKTWAGRQDIGIILKDLILLIPDSLLIDQNILDYRALTSVSVTSFDVSKSENKLDVGFSHDSLQLYSISTYTLTELLSLIGLQRFNPIESKVERYKRFFNVWKVKLDINIASTIVNTIILPEEISRYSFTLYRRDSGGRYKSFALAKKVSLEVEK